MLLAVTRRNQSQTGCCTKSGLWLLCWLADISHGRCKYVYRHLLTKHRVVVKLEKSHMSQKQRLFAFKVTVFPYYCMLFPSDLWFPGVHRLVSKHLEGPLGVDLKAITVLSTSSNHSHLAGEYLFFPSNWCFAGSHQLVSIPVWLEP